MVKDTSLQTFGCYRAPGGSGTVLSPRPKRRKSQDSKTLGLSKPTGAPGRGLSYSIQLPHTAAWGQAPVWTLPLRSPLGYSCSSWVRLGVPRALPWFLHPPRPPHTQTCTWNLEGPGEMLTTSLTLTSSTYPCCSVAKSCPALCDPIDCSTPGFPVLHHLPESAQVHVF